MHPFLFFALVAIAIWILSAIANAISKQKAMQHRQQFRQEMQQSPLPPQMQRQLNPQYAVRHPEMMARPRVQRTPRTPAQMPMRSVPIPPPAPVMQRPQQQRRRPQRGAATPPPIPVLEADEARQRAVRMAQPAASSGKPQAPTQAVTAPAISRWLKPGILRQQFILTEIFQPPLALRDDRLS